MNDSPLAIARALHASLEAGRHGEALAHHFTLDATTTEHPNLIKPKGAKVGLGRMLEASAVGAALLETQRYDVHSAIEHGPTAILRLTWTGVIARDAGPFRKGQLLSAHIAQFIETRGGRISSIETYDCYEPFA